MFAWSSPANRPSTSAFTFTLKTEAGAALETVSTSNARLLLTRKLAPGQYRWAVRYTDKNGVARIGDERRFEVLSGADARTLPSAAEVLAKASAKARPRMLPTGSSFAALGQLAAQGETAKAYAAFLARAELSLNAALPVNPDGSSGGSGLAVSMATYKSSQDLRKVAEGERKAIEAMGYAARFRSDAKYSTAAVQRLMNLAGWSPAGNTSESANDQANREIYLALAQGLDLLADKLTSTQASTVATSLRARLQQVIAKFGSLNTVPYDSHLLSATGFTTEALLLSAGHPAFPEASAMLEQAYLAWIGGLGTWGEDGGYGNGDAYAWYTLSTLPRQVAALRLITGFDISHLPAIARLGDNMIATSTPGGGSRSAFGDDVEKTDLYANIGFDGYRLIADLTRNPVQEWYWRQLPANVTPSYALGPEHFMIRGLLANRPSSLAPSSNAWVFDDIGHVAFHTSSKDPKRSSVLFRSGRFGTLNHNHADQNSLAFRSKGQDLLISGGYYPYYQSPHHSRVTRATRFKTALTFNGGIGQAEPLAAPSAPGNPVFAIEASGRLLNFHDDGVWAATTGDATLAYRGRDPSKLTWSPLLNNAVRSLAWNRSEGVLLIYDWATSTTSRSWELNFQTPSAPALATNRVTLSHGGQTACLDFHAPVGNLSSNTGFPVAPENGGAAQFRAVYKVATPTTAFTALTVLREGCRNVPVTVTTNGTQVRVVVNGGAPVTFDQRQIRLYE